MSPSRSASTRARKLARIERHLTEDTRVDLELAIERNRSISANQYAELTVWTRGPVLRAHESAEDMYAAIDLAVDKLDRQVRRYRERRRHWRPHHQARDIEALLPLSDADEAEAVEADANGSEPDAADPDDRQDEALQHEADAPRRGRAAARARRATSSTSS